MRNRSNRAIRTITRSQTPIWRHADTAITTSAPKTDVLGNVTSIIGSVSQGLSSVFGSLTMNKQYEMQQQQQQQQQKQSNKTWLWIVGGLVLVVVAFVILKRK